MAVVLLLMVAWARWQLRASPRGKLGRTEACKRDERGPNAVIDSIASPSGIAAATGVPISICDDPATFPFDCLIPPLFLCLININAFRCYCRYCSLLLSPITLLLLFICNGGGSGGPALALALALPRRCSLCHSPTGHHRTP